MRVWIKSLVINENHSVLVDGNKTIGSIKEEVRQWMESKTNVYSPPKLVFKGKVLQDDEKATNILKDGDQLLFLFSLVPKPAKQEPQTVPKETKPIVQRIVDNFIQSSQQNQQTQQTQQQTQQPAQPPQQPPQQPQLQPLPNIAIPPIETLTTQSFILNFPFPDDSSIELLMGMGFSEYRAKKALLLHLLDVEAAVDWLIDNQMSPTIDAPLTEQQIAHLLRELNLAKSQNNDVEKKIVEAIQNKKCTISATGKEYVPQKWFHCFTCGYVDTEGVCESCMQVCHQGHKVSEGRHSSFFCDCGSGPSCKCNK